MSGRRDTPPSSPWRQVVADLKARGDDLSLRAAREIESLREQLTEERAEARENARVAAAEGMWKERLGEDYGSY